MGKPAGELPIFAPELGGARARLSPFFFFFFFRRYGK